MVISLIQVLSTTISASSSKKKAVSPTAALGELCILLTTGTLLLLLSTFQTKKIQMQEAGNSYSDIDDIAVTTTFIQMVETLKIYKLDFYYSN